MCNVLRANIFSGIPKQVPQEIFETLVQYDGLRIERIISDGQSSPEGFWYNQSQHEWVILLAGAAELGYEDGSRTRLGPGDFLHIPAYKKHRVEWTAQGEKTIWLAIHFG